MQQQSLRLPSPAKLNLFLHILGRRSDGYHELQTLFQLLDLADTVQLIATDDARIMLDGSLPGVDDDDHLAVRAARLLQETASSSLGATIAVDKHLPMGGGLGGGSSNAATVLLGLNHLWNLNYPLDQLADLGRSLGADVPVFVRGHSCFAEGIGERCSDVELPDSWYLIVRPDCAVATAAVFGHPNLTRDTLAIRIPAALNSGSSDKRQLGRFFLDQDGKNDCQPVVSSEYHAVEQALEWLGQYADAKLTGTGSCIFASLPSRQSAEQILGQMPSHYRGWIARGTNRSTAHDVLRSETGL